MGMKGSEWDLKRHSRSSLSPPNGRERLSRQKIIFCFTTEFRKIGDNR